MAALQELSLAETPALMPPPGVTSNFVNPTSLGPVTNALLGVSLALTAVFIALRMVTKHLVDGRYEWEDWSCLFSWVCLVPYSAIVYLAQSQGAGRHEWDVNVLQAVKLAQTANIGAILYGPVIYAAKLSIFLLYRRLFIANQRDWVFWGIHVLIWSNFVFYTVETFLEIFACVPRKKIWNPEIPGRCIGSVQNYTAVATWNVLSDFSMLIFPLVTIWNLQIPVERKISISAVFATGFLACVATVARLVYTVKLLYAKDYTYVLDQLALWNGTEMTTIILCACMPTLPKSIQLFKGKHKKPSSYQQTPLNDANFRKSRGGGVVPRNLTATGSSWLESDDHEMQVVGDYQPLEGEQVTKPRPLSKIHSVIDPTCWGEPSTSRDDPAGPRNNAIWKTVHIENSSDLKRASKPNQLLLGRSRHSATFK